MPWCDVAVPGLTARSSTRLAASNAAARLGLHVKDCQRCVLNYSKDVLKASSVLVTAALSVAELPLFFNWRCHARRLRLPFTALSWTKALHEALCASTEVSRQEFAWRPRRQLDEVGRLGLVRDFLSTLPTGVAVWYVHVDVVLLRPLPRPGPIRIGRSIVWPDLGVWPAALDPWEVGSTLQGCQEFRVDHAGFSCEFGVFWVRAGNATRDLFARAAKSRTITPLGIGADNEEDRRAFFAALRQDFSAGSACLACGHGRMLPCPLLVRLLNLVLLGSPFRLIWLGSASGSHAVAAYGPFAGIKAQVHAMRQRGHWSSLEYGAFTDLVGTWDIKFSHGYQLSYHIDSLGGVSASSTDGTGKGQLEELVAGYFSHRLVGLHRPGKWERLRVIRRSSVLRHSVIAVGGDGQSDDDAMEGESLWLELEHWDGTRFCCTAHGLRRPLRRHTSALIFAKVSVWDGSGTCGCPAKQSWSLEAAACNVDCGDRNDVAPAWEDWHPSLAKSTSFSAKLQQVLPRRVLPSVAIRSFTRIQRLQRSKRGSVSRVVRVAEVRVGDGGGLASKFQLAVARAAAALRLGRPFRFSGHLGRYTNNTACLQLLGTDGFLRSGWPCLFRREVDIPSAIEVSHASRMWPRRRSDGVFAARYLQALLWQPSSLMNRRLAVLAKHVGYDRAKGLLAIHVRRGDKVTNFYNRYHSVETYVREALGAARKMKLCKKAPCQLFVASDSPTAVHEATAVVRAAGSAAGDDFDVAEVIGLVGTETQRRSDVGVEIATALSGDMAAFAMAAEVVFDIEMLSRASILIGTLASQITRVAASVGYSYGSMLRAVALDLKLLPEMLALFTKWGIRVDDVPWSGPENEGGSVID
eukprot:TRINITY_DN56197_c0_g1_i1.p1 TRINITY_DN56197_c0_g1~~TRINITY_DN56197_c0_g1_i1.p1  ORF type:complete len:864 (-),score=106.70 TRINITY_DN56197_c0_g1_i1:116-2707(-)